MITITFTGDILAYHNLIAKSRRKGKYDFSNVFSCVKSLFSRSSYVVGNLESPIAGKKYGYTQMDMLFNAPLEFAVAAKNAGFNMVTTANNHCTDKGMVGVDETLKNLSKIGLDHTGISLKVNDKNYIVKLIDGVKIAFISYTYGTNPNVNGYDLSEEDKLRINLTREQEKAYKRVWYKQLLVDFIYSLPKNMQDRIHPLYPNHPYQDNVSESAISNPANKRYIDRMKATICAAKTEADIVIFCLHSGGQFNNELGSYTKYLLNEIKSCGVDAIICNHPHCVLGSELVDGCFVAYSLGNFSFTPGEGYFIDGVLGEYGIVLHLDIDKKIKRVRYSIIKNVRTEDGREQVLPVAVLQNMLKTESEKTRLLEDCKSVVKRFTNGKSTITEITDSYLLYELNNNR